MSCSILVTAGVFTLMFLSYIHTLLDVLLSQLYYLLLSILSLLSAECSTGALQDFCVIQNKPEHFNLLLSIQSRFLRGTTAIQIIQKVHCKIKGTYFCDFWIHKTQTGSHSSNNETVSQQHAVISNNFTAFNAANHLIKQAESKICPAIMGVHILPSYLPGYESLWVSMVCNEKIQII